MKEYTGITCKGSVKLGTACMECDKCKDDYFNVYRKEIDENAIIEYRQKQEERRRPKQPPLTGRWRFSVDEVGDGLYLYCGTLRIAMSDFDSSPSLEFKKEVFDYICNKLNKNLY